MPDVSGQSVLVVGGGGREHALGWKLAQSKKVAKVYFAPGNGGTSENIGIAQNDVDKLAAFAEKMGDRLITVVGPEEPLSKGIVDNFRSKGLSIFRPVADAARLETSKAFSKEFMLTQGIPTAKAYIFSEHEKAMDYVKSGGGGIVVKADGVAAGKGVFVCDQVSEATNAIERIMLKKDFGSAGERVVIEERLSGDELSFIALTDGK